MEQDLVFTRYSRQIFIEEIGVAGQRKIMAAKVLVIGAGGLGSPVIQALASAGVGRIGIADFDKVELHNLNRQFIHNESSIGSLKVESAAAFVKKLNSRVCVVPIAERITADNAAEIINDYDMVVDGSDNFSTRYLVNDTCARLDKTLIYGSIQAFEGQMAVLNYKGSKQLRDLFPEAPDAGDIPDCDTQGVLGPLPGIIGSLMAMQVLKIIAGLPVDVNKLTLVDTMHWRFSTVAF